MFIDRVARRIGGRVVAPDVDGLGAAVVGDYLRGVEVGSRKPWTTLTAVSGVVSGFTVIFLVIGIGYVLGRSGTLGLPAPTSSRGWCSSSAPRIALPRAGDVGSARQSSSTLVIAGGTALVVGLLRRRRPFMAAPRGAGAGDRCAFSSSYVNSVNLGVPIAMYVPTTGRSSPRSCCFQILIYSPMALIALDLSTLSGGGAACGVTRSSRHDQSHPSSAVLPDWSSGFDGTRRKRSWTRSACSARRRCRWPWWCSGCPWPLAEIDGRRR